MTERLLSQNPFRTCDDACGARAPGGQDTPPLQRGRPNEPQDTALAPGRTVPGVGRRGSVPVRRAGARSFADDPGLSRGIVAGRAVPSLRSPEIHPPTLASVPPRSGTPPRGPRAGESGTPRAGRQKREGRGKRRRSGSPIKCSPRSTPALCPARALGAGPGPPPAPPPLHAGPLPRAGLGRGTRSPSGAPPPAPRRPSAPRGPWARDPVPLRRPPPLHACPLPRAGLGRGTRSPSGAPPPRSTPALCPARALGAGPGPPPAPTPPAPRRPSAKRPSPLRGPAPPGRPYCPCRKWEGSTRPLSSPPILGGEEASLLPSRKREGRRASVFAGARCAGTYSMGQPRRVSTQSSRRQGLWRRPGRRLRETARSAPGPAQGALPRGAGRRARASEAARTGPGPCARRQSSRGPGARPGRGARARSRPGPLGGARRERPRRRRYVPG